MLERVRAVAGHIISLGAPPPHLPSGGGRGFASARACAAEGDRFLQGEGLVAGTHMVMVTGLGFGECPRVRQGSLILSDVSAGKVYSLATGKLELIAEFPDPETAGGIGGLPNGDLLILGQRQAKVHKFDSSTKTTSLYCDLSRFREGRFKDGIINDAVADARGNLYVGLDAPIDFGGRNPEPVVSQLLFVRSDGTSTVACTEFDGFPNGMVLTPDGKTLIVADSTGGVLRAFDVAEDGSLSNQRVWADLRGSMPDGICLDADNCVWVAAPFNSRARVLANETMPKHFERTKEGPRYSCFLRVAEGGEVKDVIENESQLAIACAIGNAAGGQGGMLYMIESKQVAPERPADLTNGRVSTVELKVGPARKPGDARYLGGFWA